MTGAVEKSQGARVARPLRIAALPALLAASAALVAIPALASEAGDPPRAASSGFTPAGADPRLAAAFADRAPSRSTFTPVSQGRSPGNRVDVAVRSSANRTSPSPSRDVAEVAKAPRGADPLTRSDYELGVDVGWKRFAIDGDVAEQRAGGPALINRERAEVGASYDLGGVRPRVSVSAQSERSRTAPALNPRESYALDVGTAVKVTRNIAITGGVRYRIDQERLPDPVASNPRIDSQAVYVGGKLKF